MVDLISYLETVIGHDIISYNRVSGGDINHAFQLKTASTDYFLKSNNSTSAKQMLNAEFYGLEILRNANHIKVPEIIEVGNVEHTTYILMEMIESGTGSTRDFYQFGKQLAQLHNVSHSDFGLEHSNFIGSLPQKNTPSNSWTHFYLKCRLMPQFQLAITKNLLSKEDIPNQNIISNTIDLICKDVEPALLHGDLWSGNFLIEKSGMPILIDPAVYRGDRMVDIAMSKLFGGFHEEFYKGYYEASPKIIFKNQKIALYQLYYLLVHLNLFGISYKPSVISIINRLF